MDPEPLISVIVPFYQSASSIERSLKSILAQTIKDIEVIAIDDGSTDDGAATVEGLQDPRIRLSRHQNNLGVAAARNRGLDLARGRFIAFMDADDVSHRRRLEWLLAALRAVPDVGICGGWMRVHRQGTLPYVLRQPESPGTVRAMSLFGAPFCYASVLIRRNLILRHGIRYDEDCQTGEDHDFCMRLLTHTKGMNINKVVYQYMWNTQGLTANAGADRAARRVNAFRDELTHLLTRDVTEAELVLHIQIGDGAGATDVSTLVACHEWLSTLLKANDARCLFDSEGLREAMAIVWFRICRNSVHLGPRVWHIWHDAPFASCCKVHLDEWAGALGSMLKAGMRGKQASRPGGGPQ